MRVPIDVLEAEVLSLPEADRSRLAESLLASLALDPQWETEWSEECDRREERIARGEATWVPGHEAVARIRQTLK